MSLVYLDTSVLANRYVRGPAPDELAGYLDEPDLQFLDGGAAVLATDALHLARAAAAAGLQVKTFLEQSPHA